MKSNIICAALSLSILASCAENENPPIDAERTLRFNILTADPFDTRADIMSSQAVQSIEDVRVYVFETTDSGASYQYRRTYDLTGEWTQGGASATYEVPRGEMLANGSYRFLAVGLDAFTDYSVRPSLTDQTVRYSDVVADLNTTPEQAEEIFSGFADGVVDASTESVTIEMTRRVAGLLGYFINIPTTVNSTPVKYLRLSIAGRNSSLDITSDPSADIRPAAASEAGYRILDIDLSAQGDTNPADGIFDGSTRPEGLEKLEPSTLAGAYIVPAAFSTSATLTLSLIGDDSTTSLRSWTVRDETGATTFDILPNHFYSIGQKLITNGTIGDQPIDLSRNQSVVARIDPAWRIVHNMGVQDPPAVQ